MGADDTSVDLEDLERVAKKYVDPSSTTRQQQLSDLQAAGFSGNSLQAFADGIGSVEDVAEATDTSGRDILKRDDIERAAQDMPETGGGSRADQIVDDVARELGAPSEAALQDARADALQNLDGNTLRSNPDLDPLAEGDEGREIGDLDEVGQFGQEGGLEADIDRSAAAPDKAIYYVEVDGSRYPMAEVDL